MGISTSESMSDNFIRRATIGRISALTPTGLARVLIAKEANLRVKDMFRVVTQLGHEIERAHGSELLSAHLERL